MSSLQSALQKIGIPSVEDPKFLDLPPTADSILWNRFETEHNLTLLELSALINARCGQQPSDLITPPATVTKKQRSTAKQESFKRKLKNSRDDIEHCEICNGHFPGQLEAAHIVDEALREKLLAAYKIDKNLPVSVNDCPNGLLLCSNCHSAFDKRPNPGIRITEDGTILLYGLTRKSSSMQHLHNTKVPWLDKLGKNKDYPTPVLLKFALQLKPGEGKRLRELIDESEEEEDDERPVQKKTKVAKISPVVTEKKTAKKTKVVTKQKVVNKSQFKYKLKRGTQRDDSNQLDRRNCDISGCNRPVFIWCPQTCLYLCFNHRMVPEKDINYNQ